ncbi:MAG TPA: hypothetical protein VIJ51_12970 [Solirubrobacteraceae bacterium]
MSPTAEAEIAALESPNTSCRKAWPWTAGFAAVRHTGIHRPKAKQPVGGLYASLRARRPT